jgi:FMN phosphatase YigB (HAD superfamily)
MLKYKLLIIDWGDTICNTTGTYNKISSQILSIFAKHGINLTADDYLRLSFKVRNDLRHEFKGDIKRHAVGLHEKRIAMELGRTITDEEAQKIDAEIFELFLDNLSARDGTEVFLQEAKERSIRIFLISNSNKDRLYAEINALGFMKYFDKVICSQECGYEKSGLAPYKMALEEAIKNKWIESASDVLAVGDREEEDGSARILGIEVYIINKNAPDAFARVRATLHNE